MRHLHLPLAVLIQREVMVITDGDQNSAFVQSVTKTSEQQKIGFWGAMRSKGNSLWMFILPTRSFVFDCGFFGFVLSRVQLVCLSGQENP